MSRIGSQTGCRKRARQRDHAPGRFIASGESVGCRFDQRVERLARIDAGLQDRPEPVRLFLQIEARSLRIEVVLRTEAVLKTRRADAHDGEQIVEGTALKGRRSQNRRMA